MKKIRSLAADSLQSEELLDLVIDAWLAVVAVLVSVVLELNGLLVGSTINVKGNIHLEGRKDFKVGVLSKDCLDVLTDCLAKTLAVDIISDASHVVQLVPCPQLVVADKVKPGKPSHLLEQRRNDPKVVLGLCGTQSQDFV